MQICIRGYTMPGGSHKAVPNLHCGNIGHCSPKPSVRRYNMIKATLINLAANGKYGLHFHRYNYYMTSITNIKIAPIIASSDTNWADENVYHQSLTGEYITLYEISIAWTSWN